MHIFPPNILFICFHVWFLHNSFIVIYMIYVIDISVHVGRDFIYRALIAGCRSSHKVMKCLFTCFTRVVALITWSHVCEMDGELDGDDVRPYCRSKNRKVILLSVLPPRLSITALFVLLWEAGQQSHSVKWVEVTAESDCVHSSCSLQCFMASSHVLSGRAPTFLSPFSLLFLSSLFLCYLSLF